LALSIAMSWAVGVNLGCTAPERSGPAIAPPPEAPQHGRVALTFDDHYIAPWFAMGPMLRRYHCRATFLVCNPDQLTERQVELLQLLQQDGHEIGCHGLRHVSAVEYLKEHTPREYLENEVLPAISALRGYGIEPTSWAYPLGASSPELDPLLLQHFQVLRGVTHSGAAQDMLIEGKQRRVSAIGIDNTYGEKDEDISQWLHKAAKQNALVVFYAHRPGEMPSGPYEVSLARLQMILETGNALGMRFVTLSSVAASPGA
jgi:peptidoglycan/xylan/chitin deacetylase (PgdA/CDA1 family)